MAVRDGRMRVRPYGLPRRISLDFYHRLMRLSLGQLGGLFVVSFIAMNLGFAAIYRLDPQGLMMPPQTDGIALYWRDFFFSVHTVATIGYGNVYPVSAYANVMVVIEITLGIMFFALATGMAFARFSRPTARLLFSKVMVVHEVDGVPTLMLRAANQRHNMLYAASAQLAVLVDSEVGGTRMRRFFDLRLVRSSNPTFALTWMIMHPVDADSPLRAWLDSDEARLGGEIVATLSGTDEVSGQMVHGRWAYGAEDIHWDARFEDIVGTDGDGARTIDYSRFHAVMPI